MRANIMKIQKRKTAICQSTDGEGCCIYFLLKNPKNQAETIPRMVAKLIEYM